jgi:hypothetical protein
MICLVECLIIDIQIMETLKTLKFIKIQDFQLLQNIFKDVGVVEDAEVVRLVVG